MKVENTSARLVHLNLGTGNVKSIAPLQTITLDGEDAKLAKAVLDGPLSGLVDNGELVIDGKAKAPPASLEPSQPSTGAPPMLPGSEAAAAAEAAAERDTDPIPPGSGPTPSSSSIAGGGTRKR